VDLKLASWVWNRWASEEGGVAVAAGGIVGGGIGVIVVVVAEFVGITGAEVEPAEWVPADTGGVLLNEPFVIG
jgi:hypothetical protein